MTMPQTADVHHIFEAWLALTRIEKQSPLIKELTRELRQGLTEKGYTVAKEPGTGRYLLKRKHPRTIE